jgi:pimeloyl-ACP methyl ester carboxylesterase
MPSVLPETRYAKSGDLNIAYQVVGEGPFDLVYVPGWVSNVEAMWEEPSHARLLGRLAAFSRLILFDKRGTGMSDPVPVDRLPTLEERMDDVRAVVDAAGSERAAIFGSSEGGLMSVLFSATSPERIEALITLAIYATRLRSPDYPWTPSPEARAAEIEEIERTWGGEMDISNLAPERRRGIQAPRSRLSAPQRQPGAAVALLRMNSQIDVRDVLPTIRVPTLVLQRVDDRDMNVEEGRWSLARFRARST